MARVFGPTAAGGDSSKDARSRYFELVMQPPRKGSMSAAQAFEAIRAFEEHEHRDLSWGLGRIHEAGHSAGAGRPIETRRAIREILAWSASTLAPHIAWEESWLYPQIEQITGTPWSTYAARHAHHQITAVVARLGHVEVDATHSMTSEAGSELCCHLFALEALLRSHIDQEEKLLLPVLGESEPQ